MAKKLWLSTSDSYFTGKEMQPVIMVEAKIMIANLNLCNIEYLFLEAN